MKKLIAFFILSFFCSTNVSYALSELYYLKNVKTAEIQPYVEDSYVNNGFNIIKQNPYYGISQSGDDYAIVILQQSGENMFYYYQSEKSNKINKAVLKDVKKKNKRSVICSLKKH